MAYSDRTYVGTGPGLGSIEFNCYRPERSCGKVMFSQAFMILFGGGAWQGGYVCGGGGGACREASMAGGCMGHAWQGGCMGGHAW